MGFYNRILNILDEIRDPEIPVISIVELGVVRSAKDLGDGGVEVSLTPTYSGCPAMKQMEDDVVTVLQQHGFKTVNVKMVYSPAWTTDWLTDYAKEKLQ